MIPTLLRTLNFEHSHPCVIDNRDKLYDLTAFTNMTSLTMVLPPRLTDPLKLPPNLLKLSISCTQLHNRISFPPGIVDLELSYCGTMLTDGWLLPARLKRLSLHHNELSSFNAVLHCCEYLSLEGNPLQELEIEAPVLEHIDLSYTLLTSIPKLPDSLQALIIRSELLKLSPMSILPSSLKLLDLAGTECVALPDLTFPSSLEELYLCEIYLLQMSGVKFAKGSKLKELSMSSCDLKTIDDRMIELPLGLKSLGLHSNLLKNIDKLTIPQTVTSLELEFNNFGSLKVNSYIETLNLRDNYRLSRLTIPKKLELKFLDVDQTSIRKFSFDMIGAKRLTQVRLDSTVEEIDFSEMPTNFQILEYHRRRVIEGLHNYPNTNIWRPLR